MTSGSSFDPRRLLEEARGNAGDEARGQLLESYRGYLTLLARLEIGRKLQGKVDPADLVQETFLEAHRGFARFEGRTEAEFLAWLRGILAHRLAKLLRRYLGTQQRDIRLERELAVAIDQSSQVLDRGLMVLSSSPSQQAKNREQAALLAEALGRLPEDYREVLILRHLEEQTFPEVARRMGRSVEAVKKLWARAVPRLREVLGEDL
jgi:RNA polymerase sigma-70 factor (ECF subfamily)